MTVCHRLSAFMHLWISFSFTACLLLLAARLSLTVYLVLLFTFHTDIYL